MTSSPTATERVLSVPDEQTRWEPFAPRYARLERAELTPEDVPAWLSDWSALDAELMGVGAKLATFADLHTGNEAAQTRYAAFLEEVVPQATRADHILTEKLLAVPGYVPAPDFALTYRRFRDAAALFRETNVELEVTHAAQMNRHGVVTGNQQVRLQGEELTVPQARQRGDSPDRREREEAWRALAASNLGVAPDLDALMLELIGTRRQLARNADLPNFRDYMWKRLDRVDYTPEDCLAFHAAVQGEVVPLTTRMMADIAERLGLDSVRPWDYNRNNLLDPEGRESLILVANWRSGKKGGEP